MTTLSSFFLGVLVGVMAGVMFRDAWQIIKTGLQERRMNRKALGKPETVIRSIRGKWQDVLNASTLNKIGMVLTLIAGVLICLGVFQVVGYTRMSSFIECQAEYNQSSSEARDARLAASEVENQALYDFLKTIPPIFDNGPGKPSPGEVREGILLQQSLKEALEKHREYELVKRENPYEQPNNTCGDY